MPETTTPHPVLDEIRNERARQDVHFGEQNWPDGTGPRVPFAGHLCYMGQAADDMRRATKAAAGEFPGLDPARYGPLTWRHILLEEVFEALAECDEAKLRVELVQVTAVAVAWVEAIDRRTTGGLSSIAPGSDLTDEDDEINQAWAGSHG